MFAKKRVVGTLSPPPTVNNTVLLGGGSVVDPSHFGADPDPRIRTSD
jgi:hypothetical protein